ncbi:flagellar protein FlaG [Marinobacteraceae bacterium S3BR75-40.1]
MNDVNFDSTNPVNPGNGRRGDNRASSPLQSLSPDSSKKAATPDLGAAGNTATRQVEGNAAQNRTKRIEEQREALQDAVTQLNDYVQSVQRDLQFEIDDDTGETVVRVLDKETQEVVRQIPDEVAMRLAQNLQQQEEPISLLNIKV